MIRETKRVLLCTFIDAFGWELLRRHSFLDDVLTTKMPLGTVLGYSSTCIPTILTGKLPREHGHLSFFYYGPETSPFRKYRLLKHLPRFLTRRGRVRRIISRQMERQLGYSGYFQIYNVPFEHLPYFDYSEKKDIFAAGGINGGVPTLFDFIRDRKIPHHISHWRLTEEENLSATEDALAVGRVEFAFLYLAGMDAILHAHGTEAPEVKEKIAWYDTRLRRIVEVARKIYDEVRIFIFSDHGMTDTRETFDLMGVVEGLDLQYGTDYVAMYDSTMARFWFPGEGARDRIRSALQEVEQGDVLSDEDLQGFGLDFPGRKYGEMFFLMKPGILLCPSYMGETPLPGMHGYHPEDPDSVAMFCTNVEVPSPPRRLDDLHDLLTGEVSR